MEGEIKDAKSSYEILTKRLMIQEIWKDELFRHLLITNK